MKVLVVGSGGREHALAWKIAQSPLVETVLVAPGSPGTEVEAGVSNLPLPEGGWPALAELAHELGVQLAVVGPEAPLVEGLADELRERGIATVGPNRDGALLEASKAFAKEIMVAAGVPTARYGEALQVEEINEFCDGFDGAALVVKADGLAAGKGVVVCDDVESARREAIAMMTERPYGDACDRIVLEERLIGIETSYIVLAAGEDFVALPTAQDHKRLLDGDEGPNTGGMGAYSPAPFVSDALRAQIEDECIRPVLRELRARGIDFRGFLFAGLMLTDDGPKVLEYNVRAGDPETQVLLTALEGDLVPALQQVAAGRLALDSLGPARASAVVVLAAEGYPHAPVKGVPIDGLDAAARHAGVQVFHAGTTRRGDRVVTNGGRVLGVTASAATPEEALRLAYAAVAEISWPGMQHRRDIGKALKA